MDEHVTGDMVGRRDGMVKRKRAERGDRGLNEGPGHTLPSCED